MTAAEPERTGKKKGGPADPPPAEAQPEDQPGLDEGEAEEGVVDGVYFSKAPGRDIWYAYDADDEPVGRVYRSAADSLWHVSIQKVDQPVTYKSAVAGKAYLAGYARALADHGDTYQKGYDAALTDHGVR